jgi:ribosomal protein L33
MSKKKKQNRVWISLKSAESVARVWTEKKRVAGHKLSLKKYDPILRKHVIFTESK